MFKRENEWFEVGDVVAIKGKPCIITELQKSNGRPAAIYHELGPEGTPTGFGHTIYSNSDVEFIDGAKSYLKAELPPNWQPLLEDARKQQQEDQKNTNEKMGWEDSYHPSYAVASFSRVTGHRKLFMSSFRHQHFICFKISRAYKSRSLSDSKAYPRGELIEIAMSAAQFAELITTLNTGGGVPVTLTDVYRTQMPEPPEQDETQIFHDEVKRDANKAAENLDEAIDKVKALLDKAAVTKADRREVLSLIEGARSRLTSGIPFVVEQFQENMDKIVSNAKIEIDATISMITNRLGMKALADGAPLLLEEPKKPTEQIPESTIAP